MLLVYFGIVAEIQKHQARNGVVMGITLDEAQKIVSVAVERSRTKGVHTAIAVVDNAGSLIALARLDGARSYYPDVARGKAMATALWDGTPSRELSGRSGSNSVQQAVNHMHGGRIVFAPGAVAIMRGDEMIGVVGVGGSGPDCDEEIAIEAAKALD